VRKIVVCIEPQVFTRMNVCDVFSRLSGDFPSEDFLLIDAVSTARQLRKAMAWYSGLKSFPFGDVASLGCGTDEPPQALSAQYWRTATGESINYYAGSGAFSAIDLKRVSYGCYDPNDSVPDLVSATISDCKDVVQRLLNSGVSPNFKSKEGWAPVFEAAYWNRGEILKLLLDSGGDINQTSLSGWTPLIAAAIGDVSPDRVEFLLGRGADVNARTEEGRTALIYAVERQKEDVVKLLLAHGADVYVKDGYGKTAMMIANEKQYENIVRLLQGVGATMERRPRGSAFLR